MARPLARMLDQPGEPLGPGDVRIHTGVRAAASAQAMQARAYTYGQEVVFNRGEFDPSSPGGRELLRHELAHTRRQTSPRDYCLAFQKQSGAPAHFFDEVDDAIRSLQSRIGTGADVNYLKDLLALSQAADAQDQGQVRQLTPKVVGASPSSGAPVDRSEAFVNELLTRTLLMGLDAEAARLRTFFRTLAAMPSRRGPLDTRFGADTALWRLLVTRAIEQARFSNAAEAEASINALLTTFRQIAAEAAGIDYKAVQKSREENYSAGAYYNDDTLDGYFGGLISRLRGLVEPIFHGVQVMMEAAIAELEADRGTAALGRVKRVLETAIAPAFNRTIGDTNLLELVESATRSTFGPQSGKHLDYYDRSPAGAKRSVTINYYDRNQTTGFTDKLVPVGYLLLTRAKQIAFLEQFYVAGNRTAMGKSPLKLESVDDWRQFLHAKTLELVQAGKSREEVLLAVIKFLSDYLAVFTTSTPFNIEDVIRQDSENYNKRTFPRNIAGQLIEDCGVYALRTVYMLSLVKSDLNLRIRFVFLPVHVGLVITGDGLPTLIAHNNKFDSVDAATVAKERAAWAARDPSKPTTDDQFIGELAGSFFTPGVDVPFRLEEAPAIPKDDPRTKEKLQQFYQDTLNRNVLADAPKAGLTQFHLEYLRLNEEAKRMYNDVVVPAWNLAARKVWDDHKGRLLAEIGLAREGKPHRYAAVAKAYLDALDAAFKPVDTAARKLDASRAEVSDKLGAHPELTATGATRGYGRRIDFSMIWEQRLDAHRQAVLDQTNLKDPAKPAAITPPFATPKGLLEPVY